jgi:hypothetical protein
MGHIGKTGIQDMHNKGMVEGFPNCSLEVNFYEHCIYGKHNCVRFPSRYTREKWILELIHSDMFGNVSVPSLGESMYYVSCIEDFSRIMGRGSRHCCYLINRSPSSMIVESTPHEVWFGKNPSLSHLRVFGCNAFVHVPKEKRNKLDNKAVKCIFNGYNDGMK